MNLFIYIESDRLIIVMILYKTIFHLLYFSHFDNIYSKSHINFQSFNVQLQLKTWERNTYARVSYITKITETLYIYI